MKLSLESTARIHAKREPPASAQAAARLVTGKQTAAWSPLRAQRTSITFSPSA